LARAAYSKASYVLLDDPLSAVDAPTARHLFDKCILGAFKGRTVLLVSHSASLVLPSSDFVVVLENGLIVTSGIPKEVMQNKNVLDFVSNSVEVALDGSDKIDPDAGHSVSAEGTSLIDKEGKATGAIRFETYVAYLKACGGWQFIFWISVAFSITTAASFLETWWIQQWTDSNHDGVEHSSLYYISVFGVICLIEMVANIIQYVVQFYGGWHASKILHHRLLDAILGAPLRFFEVTPVGRLINRFSKDLSDIDTGVMWTVIRFGTLIFSAVSSLIIVSYVTPEFLFAILLQFFYSWFAKIYLSSSRELKRIESVSSSPIYAQFSEMINGMQTIRAYGSQHRLELKMQEKVDSNHRAFFYLFVTNRWLFFRNSVLSGLVVAVAGIISFY
jgi:ABC-type multidrug transport system fused ATPase/permease subunit